MAGQILSTYRILKEKACNANIDKSWAEWAIEMMESGYELDMNSEFQNLALLYWAKDDLIYEDNQLSILVLNLSFIFSISSSCVRTEY